jgi:hypothetical protein
MTLKPSLLLAVLCLSACGGSKKEPAAPAIESSATPSASVVADAPKSEATPAPAKEPEASCEKDSDCTIFADCCSCRAVGSKDPSPVPCDSVCGESRCEVKGKTIADVACVNKICKLK